MSVSVPAEVSEEVSVPVSVAVSEEVSVPVPVSVPVEESVAFEAGYYSYIAAGSLELALTLTQRLLLCIQDNMWSRRLS